MSNKLIIAIAVALVVVVAAVGVYFIMGNDKEDPNEITFLIEDDKGVYFWMTGTGETGEDALIDAAKKSDVKLIYTSQSWGMYLTGINGLEGDLKSSTSWGLFVYEGNEWVSSEVGISTLVSSDYDYAGWFFGIPDENYIVPLPDFIPDVKDAKAWDKDTKGVTFTIESLSGMYFRVSGSGETVYDAMTDADSKYKMGFVGSDGLRKGIDTLFGYGQIQDKGIWYWWSTYVLDESQNDWESSNKYIGEIPSSEASQICFIYTNSNSTIEPSAPVYKA
jgi:hypothetical protein